MTPKGITVAHLPCDQHGIVGPHGRTQLLAPGAAKASVCEGGREVWLRDGITVNKCEVGEWYDGSHVEIVRVKGEAVDYNPCSNCGAVGWTWPEDTEMIRLCVTHYYSTFEPYPDGEWCAYLHVTTTMFEYGVCKPVSVAVIQLKEPT